MVCTEDQSATHSICLVGELVHDDCNISIVHQGGQIMTAAVPAFFGVARWSCLGKVTMR